MVIWRVISKPKTQPKPYQITHSKVNRNQLKANAEITDYDFVQEGAAGLKMRIWS
jgi:hypothetical protein